MDSMRKIVYVFLAMMVLIACSEKMSKEDLAAKAAKEYYDHLLAGRYGDYLRGVAGADSIPSVYREQLLANVKQFMAQLQQEHSGIREVRIMNAKTDSALDYTNVFLVLCFGDSTNEEIVVPMVERSGQWKMR